MKIKLLMLLIIAFTLSNCTTKKSNCGIITKDYIEDFRVTIKNNETNNKKDFLLSKENWLNAFVGEEYCVEYQNNW